MAIAMKVKLWLTAILLALALLVLLGGVSAGAAPPSRRASLSRVTVIPPWALPPPAPFPLEGDESGGGPIAPDLLRVLRQADPDEPLRVIVSLREQVRPEAVTGQVPGATESRSRVVSALQDHAARSQAPLRAYLEGARATGLVQSYTPFWIFNGIAVHARPSVVRALAEQPSVAAVHLDHWRQWVPTSSSAVRDQQPESAICDLQSETEWNVTRIRADQVWSGLNISGTGALVAGMDTGVDWLHPALQANYQGYNPHGPAKHIYSWYDATGGGALYPVDGHGHGSHTLGTAVGQGGIGVAPGARWIAVRVLNSQGYGYDSWVHAGFQWLLAPGGDPAWAPDVVNCSWGNDNGFLTTFQLDLRALRAADVFPVFSSGNNGSGEGTVASPASLPEAFAVGATDVDDELAGFSSRGPSPWGEIRPHVVAPGVDVRSSLPGGAYDLSNGTSMAAPHISGIVALLRSISPTLSITRAAFLITSTAVPLGAAVPNNDAGWGRVDAFAAAAALAQPGFVTGTVARASDGVPIAGAMVVAVRHGGEAGGSATTAGDGSYLLALAPATYDLTASAFGYQSSTAWGIGVVTDTTARVDFSLTPLPAGVLRGRVTDATTGRPLTATLSVEGTPLETSGTSYDFTLPAGTYTVRARSLGYRILTSTATVVAGQTTVMDVAMHPAPSILLVDSGAWYYGSQAGYFRQALDDLAYACDEWSIKYVPEDVPTASDLTPYDIVVWTAPSDAPGYIGAQDAITGYLSIGGRLLLSGQDVGYMDGGGWGYVPYYRDYLKARLVRDDAEAWTLQGTPEDLFAGLTITITGPGGADNQGFPDEIAVADSDAAAPVWAYQGDGCGGVRVGTCLDYRVIYFSFGFEAINDRMVRREVMGRALDWLAARPPAAGIELEPASQMRIGLPGSAVAHVLRIRHVGQAGSADQIRLSLGGASWDTRLSAPSLTMAPCTSVTVMVTVTIPSSAAWDARDVVTLTARSSLSSTLIDTAVLTTKVPAPILLVDDDRWYDQEDKYEAVLVDKGLAYDYWRAGQTYGEPDEGSPRLDVLHHYPIVVWFTGYDWYAPVTSQEEATLAAYLDGGGRLFLSSQDFLYYHHDGLLSRDYLGVITYTECVTPTLARGVPEDPVGDRLGPYLLEYPFRNWSDSIVPAPGTATSFRDQQRHSIAVARQDRDHRTLFLSFPFETLPQAGRADVMERAAGWLSWLGSSTFAADRGAVSAGDVLTYTIVLRSDGLGAVSASLSNTIPLSLTLISGSLTGPAIYQPATRRLSWDGTLVPGTAVTVTYRATVAADVPTGTTITNHARVGLEDQSLRFHRSAVVRVGVPDLSPSSLGCEPSPARPSTAVTCTLRLFNAGPGDALAATAAISLPVETAIVSGSLNWEGGGSVETLTGAVRWSGPLVAGGRMSLTYQLTLPGDPVHPPLYSVAFLEDGTGGHWERATWLLLEPLRRYFPLILKDGLSEAR